MGIGFVAEYFDITVENGFIVKKIPFICLHLINKAKM